MSGTLRVPLDPRGEFRLKAPESGQVGRLLYSTVTVAVMNGWTAQM